MTECDSCPTCGSKNFVTTENNTNSGMIYKNECNNCKKFWYI